MGFVEDRLTKKVDIAHNKKIYLCHPNKDVICELNGVQIGSVEYTANLKDYDALTFNVDRYVNTSFYRCVDTTAISYISDEDVANALYTEDEASCLMSEEGVYRYWHNKSIESNGYEMLRVYMLLYLEDIGYFQIQEPTLEYDGYKEFKIITAYTNMVFLSILLSGNVTFIYSPSFFCKMSFTAFRAYKTFR